MWDRLNLGLGSEPLENLTAAAIATSGRAAESHHGTGDCCIERSTGFS